MFVDIEIEKNFFKRCRCGKSISILQDFPSEKETVSTLLVTCIIVNNS